MAEKLCLEPIVCLQWITERPHKGGKRQSPDFCLLEKQWHLEMELAGGYCNVCRIWLRSRHHSSSSRHDLSVDCQLQIAGGGFFCRSNHLGSHLSEAYCLLDLAVTDRPSRKMEEWTVTCLFKDSCNSLSLQVDNKAINISVTENSMLSASDDQCFQASQDVLRDMESLSSDMSSLLEDEILPDFELKCGGRTFLVHRSVLAARSEVFRAMMRNRMKESESGSADINDLEVPILEFFLKFLYSGRLEDLSGDIISKLYEAADEYAVQSLFKACSYWLTRNLTVENSVTCLHLADSHSDPHLKDAAISFILAHPGVFKTNSWSTFMKDHLILASEVLYIYAATASIH